MLFTLCHQLKKCNCPWLSLLPLTVTPNYSKWIDFLLISHELIYRLTNLLKSQHIRFKIQLIFNREFAVNKEFRNLKKWKNLKGQTTLSIIQKLLRLYSHCNLTTKSFYFMYKNIKKIKTPRHNTIYQLYMKIPSKRRIY